MLDLDPTTILEVFGATPDPHDVACVRFDVLAAVHGLEAEIAAGTIAPGVWLVRGRPLADWLHLEDVAALLRAWGSRTRRARA
jgi:hypothetical protein